MGHDVGIIARESEPFAIFVEFAHSQILTKCAVDFRSQNGFIVFISAIVGQMSGHNYAQRAVYGGFRRASLCYIYNIPNEWTDFS